MYILSTIKYANFTTPNILKFIQPTEIVSRQEEIIKSNEETFKLYQQELENRALRIKRLEMQVATQSEQIIQLKTG